MTDKVTATLIRMAARGTLEVEHLLRAARQPSPELADSLDDLALKMRWHYGPCFPEVPIGTWAKIVSLYCRKGHAGLVQAASQAEMLPFVLGLLTELRTDEALGTIVRIADLCREKLTTRPEEAGKLAEALNLAAMHSPRRGPSEVDRHLGRDFLHAALADAVNEQHQGAIMCALRYFGDETSLPLISTSPPMAAHWETARVAAVRAIRKVAKQRAGSRGRPQA